MLPDGFILRVFHHVLHALHLGAHFLDGLSGGNQRLGGGHEGTQEALEHQHPAQSVGSLHGQPYAQHQHGVIGKAGEKGGDHADQMLGFIGLHALGVHRRLIPGPFLEKPVFRPAGFDGLDHGNAASRGGMQLGAVPHLHTGNVDAFIGNDPGHEDVQHQRKKPDEGQQRALPQHQHQVKHHHGGVEQKRAKGIHQRFRDGGVQGKPPLNIPRLPLGIEFHGQPQHLPHIGRAADGSHFPVDFQSIDGLGPGDHDLNESQQDQERNKGVQPFPVFPCQQPVHKDAGGDRIDDAEQITDGRGQHDEGHRRPRADEPFAGKIQGAFRLAAGREAFARDGSDGDPCKGRVKFLHRHPDGAPGRVVKISVFPLESVQHHKMVHVPMDDTGKRSLVPDGFRAVAKSLYLKAVMNRGQRDVFGFAAIPGNPAVRAHLLQGHPFPIIGHQHGQGSRAAFQLLQLHDHGHLGDALFHRLVDFFLHHAITCSSVKTGWDARPP